MSQTKKSIYSKVSIITLLVLIAGAFYAQAQLHLFVKPCAQPITYSLGSFDNKFGLSQQDFLKDIDKAASIWEQSINKDLFQFDPNGKLKINLVYDYRQEATDDLKKIGVSIDSTQSSYDSLKLRYAQMTADYNTLKQSFDTKVANYNKQRDAYEKQVEYWNSQGGAPKNTANQLEAQRQSLNTTAAQINNDQETLNGLVASINSMVDVLNRMAKNLNLNVADYNNIGASRGKEFEEGVYVQAGGAQKIDIYEFDNQDRLVRVLAHEMGHALGLEHLNTNPDSIMYYLNQGNNEKPTIEDVVALKQLCGIN